MFKKIAQVLVAIVLIAIVAVAAWLHQKFTVDLPNYPAPQNVTWLDQHWTPEQRDWFHHADQGTQTFGIPYEWFIALEQPEFSFSNPALLSDPVYMDRYGFIPSSAKSGTPELPIGFAHGGIALDDKGAVLHNPKSNAQMTSLGLTCAACHTGRLAYENTTILIDGGPALTNIENFQKGLVFSLFWTRYVPGRFDRFADRILGPDASTESKAALKAQLDTVLGDIKKIAAKEDAVKSRTIDEGYARLDALTRIGNTVFSVDLDTKDNFAPYTAPVHFPRIWNASWFEWVQYNGSIQNPMTRNAGEALGVRAPIVLTGPPDQLYNSSIQVQTVYELEQQLAGKTQPTAESGFTGLVSPKWPEKILPPINTDLAAKGAVLYKENCQGCHLPPPSDPAFWSVSQWLPANSAGERFLNLNMINIDHVGTDAAQADDMASRHVVLPASLGITKDGFGEALGAVVANTVNRWYNTQTPPTPQDVQDQMNGHRDNGVRAPHAYKVRPLNGIWATPPYLHNGSVPTIYALLSPVSERPKTFYLGNREYDPANVGYKTDAFPGGFLLDTSIRGNSNSGHEFNNAPPNTKGVIGRLLTPDERRAIIEFLKTL
jgi:hypothetical protein